MSLENAEQQIVQSFQRALMTQLESNINQILPLLGPEVNSVNKEQIHNILVRSSRAAIARSFEVLSNEQILYWSKLYQELYSEQFKAIDAKLRPIMNSSIDNTVDQIMKVLTKE